MVSLAMEVKAVTEVGTVREAVTEETEKGTCEGTFAGLLLEAFASLFMTKVVPATNRM